MELKDKVAIVVGASRGIGRAYVLALARAGASVVAAARTLEPRSEVPAGELPVGKRHVLGLLPGSLSEVVEEVRAEGGQAIAVKCDIVREADVEAMVARTLAEFGRVDVLVNNAAIYPRYDSLKVTPEEFDLNIHVNVRGPYFTMKHVLPHMMAQRSGSIINITSGAATRTSRTGATDTDLIMYSVTKAAMQRLTTYLSEDMRPYNIAINALSPGTVYTEGLADAVTPGFDFSKDTHEWRAATPEYLGPPLIYLAQQTAETLTGQILRTPEFGKTWPA
jgi:NAD(P)-dependent dehydrogenase (short-subunit alcohol dehydrogenase family)